MLAGARYEFEAVQPRHVPVTDHKIEGRDRLVNALQPCLSVLGLDELRNPEPVEHLTEHVADRVVVLDHQDSQHGEIVQLAHRRDPTEDSVLSCDLAGDGAHGATLVVVDETRTLEKREGNAHPDFTRLEKAY